ncbi:hypothetical protein VPHK460_0280 [Vibrio phage K460]
MDKITLTEGQLLELVRQAYLSGGNDANEDCFYWCRQGSEERSEEILEEFLHEH